MNWFNKDPFEDKVKCEECKHWIDKEDAQKVKIRKRSYLPHQLWDDFVRFYCSMHKRPYDGMWDCFEKIFYREIMVDEKGVPVGYEPVKPKSKSNK